MINTPSGPSSDRPKRIVRPPIAGRLKPPSTPKNRILSATGVVESKTSIALPWPSTLRMPPSKVAVSSPPKTLPVTRTPIAAISTMGNLPSISFCGLILTPSIVPSKLSPATAGSPLTLADRLMRKSPGSLSKSGHSIPSALILIGSHDGHLKLSPDAEPTLRKTPKPGFASKSPLPRMAKLRASPPMTSEPILTVAPTDTNEINSSVPSALVSSMKSTAVIVTTPAISIFSVSTSSLKPSNSLPSNATAMRKASSSMLPSLRTSCAESRSSMRMVNVLLPGNNAAPPEAR